MFQFHVEVKFCLYLCLSVSLSLSLSHSLTTQRWGTNFLSVITSYISVPWWGWIWFISFALFQIMHSHCPWFRTKSKLETYWKWLLSSSLCDKCITLHDCLQVCCTNPTVCSGICICHWVYYHATWLSTLVHVDDCVCSMFYYYIKTLFDFLTQLKFTVVSLFLILLFIMVMSFFVTCKVSLHGLWNPWLFFFFYDYKCWSQFTISKAWMLPVNLLCLPVLRCTGGGGRTSYCLKI